MEPYKVKIGNLRADPVFVLLLPSDSRPPNYYYSHTIMNPTFTHDASGLKYYAHMMVRDQFRKPPGAIFSGNFLAVTVILSKLSLKVFFYGVWNVKGYLLKKAYIYYGQKKNHF